MKKFLFLAVFGVFGLFLAGNAEAGFKRSYCTPSPNYQFAQLNWLHEDGGIFTGHLGSVRGSWTPPPACYRSPQRDYYNQRYPLDRYPQYDRRYDRRHDRRGGGNDLLGDVIGGVIGGVIAGVIINSNNQRPAPVYTPPQPVYTQPSQVVSAPPAPVYVPHTIDRRCTSFRVTGDNQEATWAVERALRSRGYGVSSSTNCEVAVRYEEVGDPQSRIFLRVTDAGGNVRHASGAQFFKSGDTLARADAIIIAARTAVGNL